MATFTPWKCDMQAEGKSLNVNDLNAIWLHSSDLYLPFFAFTRYGYHFLLTP